MALKTVRVYLDLVERDHQAANWVVDEHGHLHLTGERGDGNVATYRAGTWDSVRVDANQWEAEAVGRIVTEAINGAAASARSRRQSA